MTLLHGLLDLKKLCKIKQLTFAYLTCTRLFPNYVFFSLKFNFGEPNILQEAISYLHSNIMNYNPSKQNIHFLLNKMDKNVPYPENFNSIIASSALDACTSIEYSLHFLLNEDFSLIESISTFATDSIDM